MRAHLAKVIPHTGVARVELRHAFHIGKAVVTGFAAGGRPCYRQRRPIEPALVRRGFLALKQVSESKKISSTVVKDTVDKDMHPPPVNVAAQSGEVRVAAYTGIHMVIIDSIILMICFRMKKRIEVQRVKPQRMDIIKIQPDSLQRASQPRAANDARP